MLSATCSYQCNGCSLRPVHMFGCSMFGTQVCGYCILFNCDSYCLWIVEKNTYFTSKYHDVTICVCINTLFKLAGWNSKVYVWWSQKIFFFKSCFENITSPSNQSYSITVKHEFFKCMSFLKLDLPSANRHQLRVYLSHILVKAYSAINC